MDIDPLVLVAVATALVGVVTLLACMRAAPSSKVSVVDNGTDRVDGKNQKASTAAKAKKKSKSKSKTKSSGPAMMAQSSGDESIPSPVKTKSAPVSDEVAGKSVVTLIDAEEEEDDENFVDPVVISQTNKKKNRKPKKNANTSATAAISFSKEDSGEVKKQPILMEDDSIPPALSPADPEVIAQISDSSTAPPPGFDGWAVVEDKRKVKGKKETDDVDGVEAESSTLPPSTVVEEEVVPSPATPAVETVTSTIKVDSKKLGLLIGPKGVTKIGLQTATNTDISIAKVEKDFVGEVEVSVTGQSEGVSKAIRALQELCTKGYCNLLAAEDFHEGYAAVNPRFLPDIIGKGGSCIKAIQAHTGVKISTPTGYTKTNERGETVTPSKVKISLAGSRDKVTQARQLILDLCRYYHTPVTHPGITHSEMDIESSYYNYIIGSKGSEIKHIQSNYKVSVHIPNNDSVNQKVLIVGPEDNVAQAEKHIVKLMEKADAVTAERAAAKAAGIALGERAKAKESAQAAPASLKQKTLGGGGGDPNARPPGSNKEEPEEEWVAEYAPRTSTMQIDLSASIPAKAKFSAPVPTTKAAATDESTSPVTNPENEAASGASTGGEASVRPAWGGMGSLGITH